MSAIVDIVGREILDSRGNPTVECDVLLESGVHGLIVLGTVGENSSLEFAEKLELVKAVVRHVAGRVPVLTGVAEYTTTLAPSDEVDGHVDERLQVAAYDRDRGGMAVDRRPRHQGRQEGLSLPRRTSVAASDAESTAALRR